ncbi:hypothetical protein [Niveispirillum irakense]|uniref:hypothetical protein n=1 Tax=Niveispirillum irakense TaxID=34011 RepID=UPI0004092D45|nr:hypothetical protein [Niveispirillum irakense]
MTIPLPPPTAADVSDALDGLLALLDASADNVRNGNMVELAGLEREVKPILDAALSLPPPDARSLLDKLEAVMNGLEALSTTLREKYGDTLGGTDAHATRIRAVAAYRRGEGS